MHHIICFTLVEQTSPFTRKVPLSGDHFQESTANLSIFKLEMLMEMIIFITNLVYNDTQKVLWCSVRFRSKAEVFPQRNLD